MNDPTDAMLVGQTLAADAEAFCALVRKYQDHVYAVAVGILADFDLARDAAQEAFLCAYDNLRKLKDPERFGSWLCGIARNTACEIRRDRQRQESLARQAAERGGRSAAVASAHELAVENEQRLAVQRALLCINEKDRETLTLYYADGLSYVEICDFSSISLGTLKGRLQRGRAALKKELAMVEQACKDNAPDEAFTKRLEEVVKVFGAKGPTRDHIPSPWLRSIVDETGRIVNAGEMGLRIDLALSHSGSARQRYNTATRFGIRRDARSLSELERLMEDRSARVRRQALRWYAVPPHLLTGRPFEIRAAAEGGAMLDRLLERMGDENFNVRFVAVMAAGTYRDAGDPRVAAALQKALDDPKHKVRHAAARLLSVPCRGCGKTW